MGTFKNSSDGLTTHGCLPISQCWLLLVHQHLNQSTNQPHVIIPVSTRKTTNPADASTAHSTHRIFVTPRNLSGAPSRSSQSFQPRISPTHRGPWSWSSQQLHLGIPTGRHVEQALQRGLGEVFGHLRKAQGAAQGCALCGRSEGWGGSMVNAGAGHAW